MSGSVANDVYHSLDVDNDVNDELQCLMNDVLSVNINIDHEKIHNQFKEVTDEDFITSEKKEDIIIDYKICPVCDIQCRILENSVICEKCGLEREWIAPFDFYNMTIDQNYNSSNNAFMSFSIVGTNSYCYNRSLMKSCADYSLYRNNNNRKDIVNKIYQYAGSKPPMNAINKTVELFDQIKNKGYVFRGNGKWGVIGACLYYACMMHNITRTPRDIAAIMNIEEKFLSQGDKILQELNELKVISIPTNYTPLRDYINRYFSLLEIDEKYKDFVVHIIERAERKHLHIKNESRTTTKCVGAIYLLIQRVPELKHITSEQIVKECRMSKSTFIKYYNLLMSNGRLLKKSFRKYKISMPSEWRNI